MQVFGLAFLLYDILSGFRKVDFAMDFMKTPKNLGFVLVVSPKVYIGLPCGFQQTRVPFLVSLVMYRT